MRKLSTLLHFIGLSLLFVPGCGSDDSDAGSMSEEKKKEFTLDELKLATSWKSGIGTSGNLAEGFGLSSIDTRTGYCISYSLKRDDAFLADKLFECSFDNELSTTPRKFTSCSNVSECSDIAGKYSLLVRDIKTTQVTVLNAIQKTLPIESTASNTNLPKTTSVAATISNTSPTIPLPSSPSTLLTPTEPNKISVVFVFMYGRINAEKNGGGCRLSDSTSRMTASRTYTETRAAEVMGTLGCAKTSVGSAFECSFVSRMSNCERGGSSCTPEMGGPGGVTGSICSFPNIPL